MYTREIEKDFCKKEEKIRKRKFRKGNEIKRKENQQQIRKQLLHENKQINKYKQKERKK